MIYQYYEINTNWEENTMLDTLTTEQHDEMIKFRDDIKNDIRNNYVRLEISDIEKYIEWLYGLHGSSKPLIVMVDSPYELQKAGNFFTHNPNAMNIIQNSPNDVSFDEYDKKKTTYIYTLGGKNWHYAWIAYQKFCSDLVPEIKTSDLTMLFDMFSKPMWDLITFDSVCIICRMPTVVRIDEEEKLHGATKPDIEWGNGDVDDYMIHGVRFTPEQKHSIINRKMSSKELLSLKNVDQRFIAIEWYGFENMLDDLGYKVLDEGKYGNKLISIMLGGNTDENSIEIRALTYPDIDNHSFKRISIVPNTIERCGDAMGWKHNCTEDFYYRMDVLKSWN